MRRPFFEAPDRVAVLVRCAESWVGTPYVVSGAVRGSGASCHRLAGAVLSDAGFHVDPPEKGATRLREFTAAMRDWLDRQPNLERVEDPTKVLAGDIILSEIGIGHIALVLDGGAILQVLRSAPTHIVSISDPNVRSRVLAAYRPMEDTEHGQ